MSILAKNLPKVSREFALELKRMFPPVSITPGMERDLIMISHGEQRVIQKILQISSNKIVSSKEEDIKPDNKEDTDNTVTATAIEVSQEEHSKQVGNWFKRFTTRTAT